MSSPCRLPGDAATGFLRATASAQQHLGPAREHKAHPPEWGAPDSAYAPAIDGTDRYGEEAKPGSHPPRVPRHAIGCAIC